MSWIIFLLYILTSFSHLTSLNLYAIIWDLQWFIFFPTKIVTVMWGHLHEQHVHVVFLRSLSTHPSARETSLVIYFSGWVKNSISLNFHRRTQTLGSEDSTTERSPDIVTETCRVRIPDSCFWMTSLSPEEKGKNAFDGALIASSFTHHKLPLP